MDAQDMCVPRDASGNHVDPVSGALTRDNSERVATVTLIAVSCYWKSHALLGGTGLMVRGDGILGGAPALVEPRNQSCDVKGDVLAELSMNGGTGVEYAAYTLSSVENYALAWTGAEIAGRSRGPVSGTSRLTSS